MPGPVTESRRPDQQHSVVGRSVGRLDTAAKARGEATYESDLEFDGMLHAAVVRSTVPHGRVRTVNLQPALECEDVVAAVDRTGLLGHSDDIVRHHGDVIAAVAATDEDTARHAVSLIDFDVETRTAVFDPDTAVTEDAPRVHPNNPDLGQHRRHPVTVENDRYDRNIDDYHRYDVGDVASGLTAAATTYRNQYRTPRVHHCNLQTHCCIAQWEDGCLELVETIGNKTQSEEELARVLGLEEDEVTITLPSTAGSSFGGRSLPKRSLEPVAATLAKETGRPVRLWFDRTEEFVGADSRHVTHFDVEMGIDESGRFTAAAIDLLADTGAYPNGVGHIVLSNSRDRPLDLYRIPNYRFEGVSVFTNNPPAGEYRGIGVTQLTAALESHVDELARRAGLDPVTVRERNFVREGETPPTRDTPIQSNGVEECLRRGLERFERHREGSPTPADRRRGWGLAAGTHTTGVGGSGGDRSQARVIFNPDGAVVVETAAIDLGQGAGTVLAQLAAGELGVQPDRVRVRSPDDNDLADPLGSVASRTTYIIGAAVREAAREVASTLRATAAASLGTTPADVGIRDEAAVTPAGSTRLTELVDEPIAASGTAETDVAPPAYGVHFAEVEVDEHTGQVRVLTYVAAQDVGFAINPALVEGQLEGAVLHGIESALYSELGLDEGKPRSANLADYPVITPWEMPDTLECELIESHEESGPYGAKGVGTPSMPPVAPAIINALRDATGTRFSDLPVDMETVFMALERGDR